MSRTFITSVTLRVLTPYFTYNIRKKLKTSTWDWLLATDNGLLKLPHTDGLLQLSPCTLIFQKAMIIWNLQRQSLLIAKHRETNQTKTDTLRFFFFHDDNLIGLWNLLIRPQCLRARQKPSTVLYILQSTTYSEQLPSLTLGCYSQI